MNEIFHSQLEMQNLQDKIKLANKQKNVLSDSDDKINFFTADLSSDEAEEIKDKKLKSEARRELFRKALNNQESRKIKRDNGAIKLTTSKLLILKQMIET